LLQSYVDSTYSTIYVSDMQKAVKWYYQAFGFQLLSIGSDFATLQIAPGRILFMDRGINPNGYLGLKSGRIGDIQNRLVQAQIAFEFPEDENRTYFQLNDPDGNKIVVMPGVFGLEMLEYSLPDNYMPYILCRLESKEEMHVIAKKIAGQSDFRTAADELNAKCRQFGMTIEGDAFTASSYSQQVDAIYACVAVSEAPSDPLPDGIEYIAIPSQEYSIFHYDASNEQFRENHTHRSKWMDLCLSKANSYYILEYYDDKHIHTHFPYQWCNVDES